MSVAPVFEQGMPCRVLIDGRVHAATVCGVEGLLAHVSVPDFPGLPFAFHTVTGEAWKGDSDMRLFTAAASPADTVADLAALVVAALAYDQASGISAADRIAARLGIGEDDSQAGVEDILRRALGVGRG